MRRNQVLWCSAIASCVMAGPASAGFVTLWEHKSSAPTTPWTVINGAPTDLMVAYPLGQPILDFPVFSGPEFVNGLAMTGEDPSQLGFAVKIGGVASAPGVGHTPPLCLVTSFAHPMYPDKNFNIKMTFELPLFDNAVVWYSGIRVLVDPDAAPGENNMKVEVDPMVKWVATEPGRLGTWVRLANARENGRQLGPQSEERLENYVTSGKIVKREEAMAFMGRLDPMPPPPGGGMNEVEIDILLADVPAPTTASAMFIGAIAALRRRR